MAKRGKDWQPAGACRLVPVPFKLIKVHAWGPEERVSHDPAFGAYACQPFDDWKRGDLVALERHSSAWHQGKGTVKYSSWYIGRRATIPSAKNMAIELHGPAQPAYRLSRHDDLWRIPYRWQHNAAQLIGQEYDSREALEAAMERGAAVAQVAA